MEIVKLTYLTFMLIGVGLFGGFVFPCLNGPFDILKKLRTTIGKPFTCPTCSFFWTVFVAGIFATFTPMMFYMIVGTTGWGILLMHVSNYQIFFQGMEDE